MNQYCHPYYCGPSFTETYADDASDDDDMPGLIDVEQEDTGFCSDYDCEDVQADVESEVDADTDLEKEMQARCQREMQAQDGRLDGRLDEIRIAIEPEPEMNRDMEAITEKAVTEEAIVKTPTQTSAKPICVIC